MLGQLIAHPINRCVTKSTARPSSLGQVWLISVLTTWFIPTGWGPLPGVIQKSFTLWLGVYRLTVFVRGFESILPPSLLLFSLSSFSFLLLFVHPVFHTVIYSSSHPFTNSSIHSFIYSYTATTLVYSLYPFIKAYIVSLILLIKPDIVKSIPNENCRMLRNVT